MEVSKKDWKLYREKIGDIVYLDEGGNLEQGIYAEATACRG